MTIAGAYLVSDGVVLGADSTTTVSVGGGVVQLLNHAQKVFSVGDGRFALCTWGAGSFGNISHRTIAARLGDLVTPATSVAEACTMLTDVVREARTLSGRTDVVGYFLGGCDPGTRLPSCKEIVFDGATESVTELAFGEARFAGQPDTFLRVFSGYAPQLPEELLRGILARMPALDSTFVDAYVAAFSDVARSMVNPGHRDVPIRDAIDYVHASLHITVKSFKFRFGPPPCGGPIEVGFITTDRKFRWASHKEFDSAAREHDAWTLTPSMQASSRPPPAPTRPLLRKPVRRSRCGKKAVQCRRSICAGSRETKPNPCQWAKSLRPRLSQSAGSESRGAN